MLLECVDLGQPIACDLAACPHRQFARPHFASHRIVDGSHHSYGCAGAIAESLGLPLARQMPWQSIPPVNPIPPWPVLDPHHTEPIAELAREILGLVTGHADPTPQALASMIGKAIRSVQAQQPVVEAVVEPAVVGRVAVRCSEPEPTTGAVSEGG